MTPSIRRRASWLVAVAALVAAAGAAALYWRASSRNVAEAQCGRWDAASVDALAKGEVAGVRVARTPEPAPPIAFQAANGAARTAADFSGRVILLNLWATWCVPCRKEMPALDALQAALGGPDFEVVAVNMDGRDPAKPRRWLTDNGISNLVYYADPQGKVFQALRSAERASGLPTTLVVNRRGCVVANLDGPAEWASADAQALLRAILQQK
ncbi:thiol:disulfide interchange protein TlpA [Chelatococcus reniformis]|uniref:Thiol:disulfide interchange protein TlpA n=1 Tax=Chelatococcus reniformis TaxID=1494448 RepID=A0A916TX84_9HYPH|nr:TlpA disulfide reductase family protein [Chelatococcus reniformis]GGC46239.1 thiol:disulfide interchange protein TlpA [Chelatococcus reniformis]